MNVGELFTEVIIERLVLGSGTVFIKYCKMVVDFAFVNCAVLVILDGDTVINIRFSVGVIYILSIRLLDVEVIL